MAQIPTYPKGISLYEKIKWIKNAGNAFLESQKKAEEKPSHINNVLETVLSSLNIGILKLIVMEEERLKSLTSAIDELGIIIEQITATKLTPQEAGKIAKKYLEELNHIYNVINTCAHTPLPPSPPRPDYETERAEILQEAKVNLARIKKREEQAAQILEGISTDAKKVSIAKEAKHFNKEAEKHKDVAEWWLVVAIILAASLLICAICFYSDIPNIADVPSALNWNYFLPRFSLLGMLLFFTAISIGGYRAERHNVVVNRHRANALNTFQTMTAATLTQDVKDAVTLTAAGAIYTPQETGFSKRGTAQESSAAKILTTIAKPKN